MKIHPQFFFRYSANNQTYSKRYYYNSTPPKLASERRLKFIAGCCVGDSFYPPKIVSNITLGNEQHVKYV